MAYCFHVNPTTGLSTETVKREVNSIEEAAAFSIMNHNKNVIMEFNPDRIEIFTNQDKKIYPNP